MSGRSTPWRAMPRGEQRFRVGVTSTGRWLAHRKVSWSRAPRIIAFLEMALVPTGAYEGSLFAEGVSVRFKASPFHEAASAAGSVFFLGFELHSLHRMERGAAWVRRRPHPLEPQEVDDRDIRGSIELSPWEENAHASRCPVRRSLEDLRSSPIHRSVHRGVKPRSTSGPRKRRRVVPQSPALEIPRTHEMRVFVSTVWMAEVGP